MSLVSRNRLLSIILFCIWPLGIALFACYQMSKRRDFLFYAIVFSLFVGLYGYVFNARYDLTIDMVRIYNHYEMLRPMNFVEGIPYFVLRGDLSLFLLWLLGRMGGNAQIVGFFVAFLSCISYIYVFDKWMCLLKIRDYNKLFIISVMTFFMTIHPTYISGVRTPIAFAFFLLGFICFFSGKKRLSLLFCILSILNHFSMIFAVFLFMICICFGERTVKKMSLILACSGAFYNSLMNGFLYLLSFAGVIGTLLSGKINYYVFGDLAEGEVRIATGSNIWYIQLLTVLGVFLLMQISPRVKQRILENKYISKLDTWIWLLIGFVLLNISNITMIARFSSLVKFFCFLLIVSVVGMFRNTFYVKLFYMIFCIFFLVAFIALIKEHGAIPEFQIAYQNTHKLLSYNLFQLLDVDVNYVDIAKQNLLIDE